MPMDWNTFLKHHIEQKNYLGYIYSYPHKTAYRRIDPPLSLREVWSGEAINKLFCYIHIPFCRRKCSYCNLFSHVPERNDGRVERYLNALLLQSDVYRRLFDELQPGDWGFQSFYMGGGTPTFLKAHQLERLLAKLAEILNLSLADIPSCVEVSPDTLSPSKVQVLKSSGIRRISIGIESLNELELRLANRRFPFHKNEGVIRLIQEMGFEELNIDLIYGLPGQTRDSWSATIEKVIGYAPESLYIYPLYIRPQTGFAEPGERIPSAELYERYRLARESLIAAGYKQITMRHFRRIEEVTSAYRCQEDGMVGLGAGARSYTTALHYSTEYAMRRTEIFQLVDEFVARIERGDTLIRHGFKLDPEEQQRRYIIKSLLYTGLNRTNYLAFFSCPPEAHFGKELEALVQQECASCSDDTYILTELGRTYTDVIGRMFFSERVATRMTEYWPAK